mmetsp:Transcript_57242/g.129695  ORF Transcript_57242/g.129695 Transcript_57242/m.129695 type:complete len:295 (-) Transcript_57242:1408-2292(-)
MSAKEVIPRSFAPSSWAAAMQRSVQSSTSSWGSRQFSTASSRPAMIPSVSSNVVATFILVSAQCFWAWLQWGSTLRACRYISSTAVICISISSLLEGCMIWERSEPLFMYGVGFLGSRPIALSWAAMAASTSPLTSAIEATTWYTSDMSGRIALALLTKSSASASRASALALASASASWFWLPSASSAASMASCCACEMNIIADRSNATTWSGFLARQARMSASDFSKSGVGGKSEIWDRCMRTSTESGAKRAAASMDLAAPSTSPLSTKTPERITSTRLRSLGLLLQRAAAAR